MKNLSLLTAMLLAFTNLSGCAVNLKANGSTVMLEGVKPTLPASANLVRMFLEKPEQNYEVIALVNSSIHISSSMDIAQAEAVALEQLKVQATQAGADGIIDVVRDVTAGDTLISSSAFSTGTPWVSPFSGIHQGSEQTSVLRTYTISFRAKAIKLNTPLN